MVNYIYDKSNFFFFYNHILSQISIVFILMSSLDVSIREKPSSPQAISNFGNFGENANPIEGEQLYIMSSKVLNDA